MTAARPRLLARARHLASFTLGYNLLEGVAGITAAVLAGSVALLGFGLDSFVESASAAVILWRVHAEQRDADEAEVEAVEARARKLVAVSLVALGLYVAFTAARSLWLRERPDVSYIGIGLTSLSIVVMWWLARKKNEVAHRLGSRSMEADAFQTTACFWLSVIVLTGIGLNALFGWWWADPLAALAIVVPIAFEAREAWEGDAD